VRVLFMGGNSGARKGVHELAQAIPAVVGGQKTVEFWLCGGGDVKEAFGRLQQSEYRAAVRYLGLVSEAEKRELLEKADVFVLPSHSEGMPYAIIEAMAAGLPIVATKVGSIPETVCHGENGLLIEAGNVEDLAASLVTLVRDGGLRLAMGSANQVRIRSQFSSQKAFDTIGQVYDELMGGRTSPVGSV
jgi:glycosyltransferase involved in cell wall biosynthesis